MKKYWIKDLNGKQVIHAPTEEIARKLCDKFHEMGLQWVSGRPYSECSRWDRYKEETCYSPSTGQVSSLNYYIQEGYQFLTIDQLLDFQANEYPKVMEVSNNNVSWQKRVVFMEKNGNFLAWVDAKSIEEAENEIYTYTWGFAREIQPVPTLELKLDEIADKFGVSVDRLKIKK